MSACPNCGHELEPFVMPGPLSDAVRDVFGPGSRTFGAISRRCAHAYRVWEEKYGPWSPEQAQYAQDLVVAAVTRSGGERARCYAAFDRSVHHETVDAGFKRRSVASTLNLADELDELAA